MTEFVFKDVWGRLGASSRRTRRAADVAVAYFGKDASKLLQLRAGSRLVVNASEHSVKNGLTYPLALKRLVDRGVRVFSVENLHAKVFVFGSTAFVGSANVSRRSANTLIEAVVATTEPIAVAAARRFVREHCLLEIGPEELDRLQAIYRAPRLPKSEGSTTRTRNGKVQPAIQRIRLVRLSRGDWPKESKAAWQEGRKAARSRMDKSRRHILDEFWWQGAYAFRAGDAVAEITKEPGGRYMASNPGKIVHVKHWKQGSKKYVFVFVERKRRRRMQVEKLARRIGRGALRRLSRGGLTSAEFSKSLLTAWSR